MGHFRNLTKLGNASLQARGRLQNPPVLGDLAAKIELVRTSKPHPKLGTKQGRPYATAIAAGSDGSAAQAQIDRIVTGWRLRRVAEPVIVNLGAQTPEQILAEKTVPQEYLEKCREVGAAFAEGLSLGVF